MVADYVAAYEATIAATAVRLRSPYDREIVRLALPALGALAAEPLYLLVDTAIVGHLGRSQLAALGIAVDDPRRRSSRSSTSSSTGRPRRSHAPAGRASTKRRAGSERRRCGSRSPSASPWQALVAALADPLVSLMGGEGDAAASR